MIDIHCHILPCVDDGAASLREALLMARVACDAGTGTMVATPHFGDGEDRLSLEKILEDTANLQQHIRQAGLEMEVLPGMELLCTRHLERILEKKDYLTLAHSRYLLTEFYFDETADEMNRMLSLIADHGLSPIIAHPERYDAVQRDPYLAEYWMKQGYGIQINAGSLLGTLGRGAHQTGKWLVHHGFAHVVASDAHGFESRTPQLKNVREYLEDHISVDCAQALLQDNPQRILRNLPLLPYK